MRLPRRRIFWVSAAVLMVVVAGAWLFGPRSPVTQENFDRILVGMTKEEVTAILGPEDRNGYVYGHDYEDRTWFSGPNALGVRFENDRVTKKQLTTFTAWVTLNWYLKKAAWKIGVKPR